MVGVWGLAFKPNTDDMRFAPSIDLIIELLSRGASVVAYDPVAMDKAAGVLGAHERLTFARRAIDAASGADALVIVTEWKEFYSPNMDELRIALRRPLIIDGRNVLDPVETRARGFDYSGIGRP